MDINNKVLSTLSAEQLAILKKISTMPPMPVINPPAVINVQVDVGEFVAVKTLLMAVISLLAIGYENTEAGSGQKLLNALFDECERALRTPVEGESGPAVTAKTDAVAHMHKILLGITLPKTPGTGH